VATPPRRILIVRTSAIGDIVFASPLAAALRAAYPDAHIAWLVEAGLEGLIASDPALDEVLTWPKAEWRELWRQRRLLALWRAVGGFRARLRQGDFDLVLDLQGLLKSGLLAWLTGARRRVGLGSREGSPWLMTEVIAKGGDPARISSEYLDLAERLGLPHEPFLPRLFVKDADAAQARAMLAAHGLEPGRYALLAPFTTRPQKHWQESAWPELASALRAELGLPALMLGGRGDLLAAERIAQAGRDIVNLAGATRLAEAAALVQDAALVVGVDTGLTHMGIAFARPTVAIFGSTRPYLETGRANARVIWLGLPCSPCRRRPTCAGRFTCLADISPARVLDEACAVLGMPA
jgi:heptosyltransferase-1